MKRVWLLLLVVGNACSASQKPVEIPQTGIPVCIGQLIKKFEAVEKTKPATQHI